MTAVVFILALMAEQFNPFLLMVAMVCDTILISVYMVVT
jgi:hypothetical protein